jgi:hypothetical protein
LTVIKIVDGVLTNVAQTATRPHNEWIVVDDNFSLPLGSKVTVTYDINNHPVGLHQNEASRVNGSW